MHYSLPVNQRRYYLRTFFFFFSFFLHARSPLGSQDVEWSETGERLTWANWDAKQKEGGIVLVHSNPPKYIDMAISHPLVMIASDGIPFNVSAMHSLFFPFFFFWDLFIPEPKRSRQSHRAPI